MKHIHALALLIVVMLVLVSCGSEAPLDPPSEFELHLLVKATDGLVHKRPGWSQPLPLTFGERLDRDDLLINSSDTEGLIVCADLSLVIVAPGYRGGLPCPQQQSRVSLTRNESQVIDPSREATSSVTPSIPYVLGPRHTFIQTEFPLLRFHPTGDQDITYTVRVVGGEVDWQTEAQATEIYYPQDAPTLLPNTPYRLIVVDSNNRSSSEENTTLDIQFALLPPEEIEQAQSLVEQVQKLDLDEQARQLLEAEIYASYKLRADAIILFEQMTKEANIPTIHRRLGDLYAEVGLFMEARTSYEHALEGYRLAGDHAGEAWALTGLGLAFRASLDDANARSHLEQAADLYQTIGDPESSARIKSILKMMGE